MDNYDGSVIIKTGLDTEGFVAGSETLARDAQKAADSIKNISLQTRTSINSQIRAFAQSNEAYRRQEEAVERLRAQLIELQQTKVETEEYKSVSDQLDKANKEFDALLVKEQEYRALGKKDNSAEIQRLVYREGVLDDQITNLKARLQTMRDDGMQYRPADTLDAEQKLAAAEQKRETMLSKLNDKYITLRERIRSAGDAAVGAHKKTQKHGGLTFKNLLKYTLGIRSLFVLFRRLRAVAKQALGVMAQQDPTLNAAISKLLTSFKQLKADIGTIVQPLVQTVAPVLTTIFDKIHGISLGIAQFFAAFVGQDYIEKAVVSAYDYADALDSVGDAAEKALGSYDKLNVISDNKDQKNSLALTKETVKYTKEALNDDSWNVKLGRRLGEIWRLALETVDTIIARLQEAPWFNGMVEKLKGLLSNPDALLITIGAIGIGKALGAKLLAGVAKSGFSSGILGLIPKTAIVAVTAVVGFKLGNWIYENLPEGLQETLADTVGEYVEAFEDKGFKGILEKFAEKATEVGNELFGGEDWWEELNGYPNAKPHNSGKSIITSYKKFLESIIKKSQPLDIIGKQHQREMEKRFEGYGFKMGTAFEVNAYGKKSAIQKNAEKEFKNFGNIAQNSFARGLSNISGTRDEFARNVSGIVVSTSGQVFYDKGIEISGDFFSGMKNGTKNGAISAGNTINAEIGAIGRNISDAPLTSKGQSVGNAFTGAITNFVNGAGVSIRDTINRMLSTARDGVNSNVLYDKGTSVGTSLGSGLNDGLTSQAQSLTSKIVTSIKNIVTNAKNGISTDDFARKGQTLGNGLANGIVNSIANSGQTIAKTLAEKVLGAVTSAYNAAAPAAATLLTPLMNGTAVPSVLGKVATAIQGAGQTINLTLDGKVVSQVVWDNTTKQYKQTGKTNLLY